MVKILQKVSISKACGCKNTLKCLLSLFDFSAFSSDIQLLLPWLTVLYWGRLTPPIHWGKNQHTGRTPARDTGKNSELWSKLPCKRSRIEMNKALKEWRLELRNLTSRVMHQSSLCSSVFHKHTCLSWPQVRKMFWEGWVASPHISSTWPCETHTDTQRNTNESNKCTGVAV